MSRSEYVLFGVHIQAAGEEIRTTPEHPFWVPQKGWTDAAKLRAGDKLILQSDQIIIIEQVQHEILESPVTVYNFEVADWHTYYVSGNGVLVHNACNQSSTKVVEGSGKINWTGKGFKEIGQNASPDDVINSLESSGWTKAVVDRGGPSGPATILTDPATGMNVRVHTNPTNGTPYFRVQNSGSNYVGSDGLFPSNATRQELRDLTHFYFGEWED